MSVDLIHMWHKRARPRPDDRAFNVQLGCHFEEIAEMMETLVFHAPGGHSPGELTKVYTGIKAFADALKSGEMCAEIKDRKEFLDSLCDQVVTSIGAGYCANMHPSEAIRRVNTSNWTKIDTVTGEFIRDGNGKIMKPSNYAPPDLEGTY
jgi:hypothetical protein